MAAPDDYARHESFTGLIRSALDDVRELFREEMALARAEIREEVSKATSAATQIVLAAALAGAAVLFLLLAVAHGIAALFNWPVGAGYLALGIILAILGGVFYLRGRKQARVVHAMLPQTTESVKENKEWIEARTSSAHK